MRRACACGIYLIDPEHATYVRYGVPLCPEATCQKVREHRSLTRVPHFDDIGHEPEDYRPNTRYEDI